MGANPNDVVVCTCFPYRFDLNRPVSDLSEVQVIDPTCTHHGEDGRR